MIYIIVTRRFMWLYSGNELLITVVYKEHARRPAGLIHRQIDFIQRLENMVASLIVYRNKFSYTEYNVIEMLMVVAFDFDMAFNSRGTMSYLAKINRVLYPALTHYCLNV